MFCIFLVVAASQQICWAVVQLIFIPTIYNQSTMVSFPLADIPRKSWRGVYTGSKGQALSGGGIWEALPMIFDDG